MDEDDFDCSEAFELLPAAEAPEIGEDDYFLEVTSPSMGDVAEAGVEYTIEVSHEIEYTEAKFRWREGSCGKCHHTPIFS